MRLSGRQIAQGQMLPRWYGLAYYELCSDEQVAYPIPVNLIVRWWRDLAWLVKRGKKGHLQLAFTVGFQAGFADGYQKGKDFVAERALQMLESREGGTQ